MVASRPLTALFAALLLLAAPSRVAPAGHCLTVEDFSKGKVGEFPPGWKPRKEAGRAMYSIRERNGLRFLHAAARGLGIQAALPHDWDLHAYPVLAWSWRPIELPAGADERNAKTNDSALAVYAVFPHTPWSVKSLKYVWSAAAPVGAHLTSSAGLTQALIRRSGTAGKGEWIEERVNVLDDYRKYFGDTDAPKPAGIAVLTDSDDTGSSAQGDYADFRVCKS